MYKYNILYNSLSEIFYKCGRDECMNGVVGTSLAYNAILLFIIKVYKIPIL